MRKAVIALGTVWIGAGIMYAFGRAREKQSSLTKKDVGVDKLGENKDEHQLVPTSGSQASSERKLPSMSPLKGDRSEASREYFEIDDHGTDRKEAFEILQKIKDQAFASSDEKLALALGRPVEDIQGWTTGEQPIDSDVLMKARALAFERGLRLERSNE